MQIVYNNMTEVALALDKSKHHYESNTAWTGGETADQVSNKLKNGGDIKIAQDRKSTRLNSSHSQQSRMPSSA